MYQITMRNIAKDVHAYQCIVDKPLDSSLAKKIVCLAWGVDEYPLECTEPVQNGYVFNFDYNGQTYELSYGTMDLIKSEPKPKLKVNFKLPELYKIILLCNLGCIIGSFGMLALTHNRTFTIMGLVFSISFITTFFINKLKNNGKQHL